MTAAALRAARRRSGSATALARRGDAALTLRAAPALLARLRPLLEPYVTLEGGGARAGWTVEACAGAGAHAAGWRAHVVTSPWEPDRRVSVRPGHLRVHETDPDWLLQQALRAARNLLRWEHRRAHGTTFAHGGHVQLGDAGVSVLGAKAAGKTTVILACMALLGARFVANDDIELDTGGGSVRALGWPRSVVVRAGTVAALAREGIDLTAGAPPSHPANRRNAPPAGRAPEHLWLTPGELCGRAGSAPLPSAQVTAVVLPRRDDDAGGPAARLRVLGRREAATALVRNVEHAPDPYDRFLAEQFPAADPARAAAAVATISRDLPCYELRYRPGSLRALADALAAGLAP